MTLILRTGCTLLLCMVLMWTSQAYAQSHAPTAHQGDLLVLASQHPLVGTAFAQELADHASQIDIASPMWFGIADDGSISPLENCDGPYDSYVAKAHEHGMKVLPIVRNFKPGPLLGNPQAIERSVADLLALVQREKFDGLVLDIEHLDAQGRQPLVDLTARLHAGLQSQGKQLVVAVASRAWKKEYDYAALAKHSDYLYIMTYDFVGPWTDRIGPTAPWSWKDQSRDIARDLKIIQDLGVPAEKMLLGMALYGADFTLPAADADKHAGVRIEPTNRLQDLAKKHGAVATFDDTLLSSWFDFTADDGKPHRVWVDDAAAFKAKLAKAREMGVAGIGVWSIRYADKSTGDDLWEALGASTAQ